MSVSVQDRFLDVIRQLRGLDRRLQILETRSPFSPVGARVIQTSGQRILNKRLTAIAFDTEIADLGGCWSSTDPTKLIAPITGWYIAAGSWRLRGADNVIYCRNAALIKLNDTTWVARNDYYPRETRTCVVSSMAGMVYMEAGDYVELYAYHEQGITITTGADSILNQHTAYFWLARLA